MEVKLEEAVHEEERRGFHKVEAILISEEKRNMAIFLQESEEASLLGAEEACWAE